MEKRFRTPSDQPTYRPRRMAKPVTDTETAYAAALYGGIQDNSDTSALLAALGDDPSPA